MNKIRWNSKSSNSQTIYNFISTIIKTGFSFLTMPLFTRLLGADQYGQYSIYLSWYNILNCFISLSVGSALATGMYKYKDDYVRFRSSIFCCGLLICLMFTGIGMAAYFPLRGKISYKFALYLLLFINSTAYYVTSFLNVTWTYEKEAFKNLILSITILTTTTLLSIVLINIWKNQEMPLYEARIIGTAIPEILIAIILVIYIFNIHTGGYVREYWHFALGFGIPTVFHVLSHQLLTSSDRIMMKYLGISNSEIGIYSFFYSFVMILSTILSAFNNSWVPFLYEDLDGQNYRKLNIKIRNYVEVFTIISCGFLMLAEDVARMFGGAEYSVGTKLIPILVLVVYFTFIYQFPVNYEFFRAKPRIIAYATSFAAIENVLLNVYTIPLWGMQGAAISTLVSYITLAIVHIIVVTNWKEIKYPLTWKPLIYGFCCTSVFAVLYYLLSPYSIVRYIIFSFLATMLIISVKKRRSIF